METMVTSLPKLTLAAITCRGLLSINFSKGEFRGLRLLLHNVLGSLCVLH